MPENKPLRILSIDGGGIRGIIPALFLARLEDVAKRPVCELFDMVAGTSTGGILALALTTPGNAGRPQYTARELVDFYRVDGPNIFSRSPWHRISSGFGLTDEKYDATALEKAMQRRFGEKRLSETLLPVLVPAYEIERRTQFLFRTESAKHPPRPNETFDYPLWQVGRATSAAPTYFEPFLLTPTERERYALVDGGVYANNPAMCAWAEVHSSDPSREMVVVSLGTGELCRPILHDEAKDWGLAGWARPVLDVIFDGSSDIVDYHMAQVLGPAYHRFQTRLDEGFDDMDDASRTNLRMLELVADRLITASEGRIADLVGALSD